MRKYKGDGAAEPSGIKKIRRSNFCEDDIFLGFVRDLGDLLKYARGHATCVGSFENGDRPKISRAKSAQQWLEVRESNVPRGCQGGEAPRALPGRAELAFL